MALTEVEEFVQENGYLEIIKDENGKEKMLLLRFYRFIPEGKVQCKLTGHQLPCRLSDIITYTSGKKYQRLVSGISHESVEKQFVSEDYKEYLEPSRKNKNQLYCKVTKKLINNVPHHIQKHVTGKRFQRQLKIYKETSAKSSSEEDNFWKPSESDSDEQEVDRLSDSFMDDEEDFDDDDDNDEDENMNESIQEDVSNEKAKKDKTTKTLKEKDSSKDNKSNKPTRKRKVLENSGPKSKEVKKIKSNKPSTARSRTTKK